MDAEYIIFLPGVIDEILLNSDFITVLNLASISKSWHDTIHKRSTWVSIACNNSMFISKERPFVSSAQIWILLQKPYQKPENLSLVANKLVSNNPRDLTTGLKTVLNQLADGTSPRQYAYAQMTTVLETNRHLLDSTHQTILETYLKIAHNIAKQKLQYLNEVLVDILKPYIFQAFSKQPRPQRFNQAVLEVAAEALVHYRKQVEFTREISKNKDTIMTLVWHILNDEYKYYKGASDILYTILSNIDSCTNELLPLLDDIMTPLKKKEITSPLQALSHSRNADIWRLVLESDRKIKHHSFWMSDALVQVYQDSPELFIQICHWKCTMAYLPDVWSKVEPQEFINSTVVKYEDWLKIRYISCLIEKKLLDPLIQASHNDTAAFNAICFIATYASAEQDSVLERTDILTVIGSKTKSKNNEEAQVARATMQKLTKKPTFLLFIAQQLKNKAIVLH